MLGRVEGEVRFGVPYDIIGSFVPSREAIRRMSTRHGGQGGAIVNLSSAAATLGAVVISVIATTTLSQQKTQQALTDSVNAQFTAVARGREQALGFALDGRGEPAKARNQATSASGVGAARQH